MERQEPQGEEQHHQVSHQQLGHIHAMAGHILQSHGQAGPSYHPPPPYSDRSVLNYFETEHFYLDEQLTEDKMVSHRSN